MTTPINTTGIRYKQGFHRLGFTIPGERLTHKMSSEIVNCQTLTANLHIQPTIYVDDLAGDIIGLIRHQKLYGFGDFFSAPEAF
jgi:hypothetical protein